MTDAHEHCSCITGRDPDMRLLRRLDLREGPTGRRETDAPFIGVAIDCETTGLDHERDEIIELACRRFRYDRNGIITKIDKAYSWLEEPSVPIPAEVTAITGIVDADVAGQRIDDAAAARLIGSATYRVAHNAAFDRKFVERRLPAVSGLAWACSCTGIDWTGRHLDGRKLGWLLAQIGRFHDAHRATADVDAVVALLSHGDADGRTALSAMIDAAETPSWIVDAIGANFEVKDLLRSRRYRWKADRRVWSKEAADRDRTAEEFWLAANVYSETARPQAMEASFKEVTSIARYT